MPSTPDASRRLRTHRMAVCLLLVLPLFHANAQEAKPAQNLLDFARNLPSNLPPDTPDNDRYLAYIRMIETVTPEERATAMPLLLHWADDDRVPVRTQALSTIYLLSLPTEKPRQLGTTLSTPAITTVAMHLRDPEPALRPIALLALQAGTHSAPARQTLLPLVLPLLQESDALTTYPDHRNDAGHEQLMRGLSPQVRAQLDAHYHTPSYPALGPQLLWLILGPTASQSSDAIIAFLDRPDQTADTMSESVRALALNGGEERVNDEALRRAFQLHSMSVFLVQFLSRMDLTPQHLAQHRASLLALAQDPATPPQLRHAATTVAACWTGDIHTNCSPAPEDFVQHDTTQVLR